MKKAKAVVYFNFEDDNIKVTSIGFMGNDRDSFEFTDENFYKLVDAIRVHWGLDKGIELPERLTDSSGNRL